MKREIKFRAWDDGKKEWLLGYELVNLGGFSIVGETVMMGEWSSVLGAMLNGQFGKSGENLKVMQYTGLKDKNGKEIYEGDVVRAWQAETETHTGELRMTVDDAFSCYASLRDMILDKKDVEIMGNIYENPGLI